MVRAVHLAPRTAGLMTLARAKRRLKLGGTATLPGKSAVDLRGGKAGRGSDNSADLLGVGRDDDGAVFGADGAAMDWGDGLEGMEGVDDWVTEEVGGKEKRVRLSSFRALVLDSSYRPIEVVNWQRAVRAPTTVPLQLHQAACQRARRSPALTLPPAMSACARRDVQICAHRGNVDKEPAMMPHAWTMRGVSLYYLTIPVYTIGGVRCARVAASHDQTRPVD